jgi:glycosyltransferase involved in cell wall biosynthesis
MQQARVDWIAVSWSPYSRRSEMFARELNGQLRCIHNLRFQYPLHAPFKYILQAARTWRMLWRERPDAIHVQTPPFVCGAVVYLYSRLTGAPYVFEYHSAAFGRTWDWARPIQSFLARHAATNIVTNQHWADVMHEWGAEALVMFDPFLELPEGLPFPLKPGFNVAFVSTFADDEPVEAVLAAAAMTPDVNYYVTGDTRKRPAAFFAAAPPNVTFTGFLNLNGEYLGLLRAADAIMVLTTRDYTLQLGGCEAVSVGKPLITSDWPYLREVFGGGAVFVSNTAEGIRDGIHAVRERHEELAREITEFRQESQREWNIRMRQLENMVARTLPARGSA